MDLLAIIVAVIFVILILVAIIAPQLQKGQGQSGSDSG